MDKSYFYMSHPFFIGIDMSKDKFDVSVIELPNGCGSEKKVASSVFENNEAGFDSCLAWLDEVNSCILEQHSSFTMEATGTYHEKFALFLYQKQCATYVILPIKSHRFMKSYNTNRKDDKSDAYMMALYASQRRSELWAPVGEQYQALRSLTRKRAQYVKLCTSVKNQQHASSKSIYLADTVLELDSETIEFLDKQIDKLEKEIAAIIKSDAELCEMNDRLRTIPGVGPVASSTVIAETSGFAKFKNSRQLVSYAGLDITEESSGSSVRKKTRISKSGNAYIRDALFLGSRQSKRLVPGLVKLNERMMQKTTLKDKVTVACSRKVLVMMFSMNKYKVDYDPQYEHQKAQKEKDRKNCEMLAQKVETADSRA